MNVSELKAVSVFAAVNDIKYFFNGLHIDFEKGILEATDGCCLVRVEHPDFLQKGQGDMIVPIKTVQTVLRYLDKKEKVEITRTTIGGIPFKPIEGRYLDCNRVIPDETTEKGVIPWLNSKYLAKIENLEKVFKFDFYSIQLPQFYKNAVRFDFERGNLKVLAVLMPKRMRFSNPPDDYPNQRI